MRAKTQILSMHEASRLWFPSDDDTFKACAAYIGGLKPGWSLTWLRDVAPHVLNNEVSRSSLHQALKKHVPDRAQASVWTGVELLMCFARDNRWNGVALPHHDVPIGLELKVRLRPSGMFYSAERRERYLLTLQPRLDYSPKPEQERIWLSSLYYEFCCDPLQPLRPAIIDLGRDDKTGTRQLRELGIEQLPILSLQELNARLSLVAKCFKRAIDIIPVPDRKRKKPKETGQQDLFPGADESDEE